MVLQESPPALRWRPARAYQILAHRRSLISMPSLSNSPWILGAPQSGFSRLIRGMSLANLERHGRSAGTAVTTLPAPEQTKAFVLPSNDGGWFEKSNARPPTRPVIRQPHPEPTIQGTQARPLYRALEYGELMTESQDFDLKGHSAPEGGR